MLHPRNRNPDAPHLGTLDVCVFLRVFFSQETHTINIFFELALINSQIQTISPYSRQKVWDLALAVDGGPGHFHVLQV